MNFRKSSIFVSRVSPICRSRHTACVEPPLRVDPSFMNASTASTSFSRYASTARRFLLDPV